MEKNELVSPKKKKSARIQVDAAVLDQDDKPQQTGNTFNIWFHNWGSKDSYQTKSPYKVNVKRDSGYTKADKIPNSFICLFFARGCCHKGKKCEYLHRLPDITKDCFAGTKDCFGRDKFSDYRDDMGGVGNLLKENRTLYVGKLLMSETQNMEALLSETFGEFGRIERIRLILNKNCAFVNYENEWNAQFAKEAMAHQSLVKDEVLNLRWANDDPNPQAKVRNIKAKQKEAIEAIKKILKTDTDTVDEIKKKAASNNKKRKIPSVVDSKDIPQIQQGKEQSLTNYVLQPVLDIKKKQKVKQVKSTDLVAGYASESDDDID